MSLLICILNFQVFGKLLQTKICLHETRYTIPRYMIDIYIEKKRKGKKKNPFYKQK